MVYRGPQPMEMNGRIIFPTDTERKLMAADALLREAVEVLRFYGDYSNWSYDGPCSVENIFNDDGKQARAFLAKLTT